MFCSLLLSLLGLQALQIKGIKIDRVQQHGWETALVDQ
jgi:hypothetical protein